jgi:hypothetical protein
MTRTGIKAQKEDVDKLVNLVNKGWRNGETMIVFSVGEGIRKDADTVDAKKACHQLALDYGLPEIEGYYGITVDGEFVKV